MTPGVARPGTPGHAALAAMTALGTVKPNRLADTARCAAAAGAYATLWTALAEVLPTLLPSVRAAGEVVAVAASCAEHCGEVHVHERGSHSAQA